MRGPRTVLGPVLTAVLAGALVSGLGLLAGVPAADAAPVVTQASTTTTEDVTGLRVGSYNIRCANCFDGHKNEKHWADRRGAVVSTILGQHLDVVGVQEASQGRIHDDETGDRNLSQFEDLLERLGGSWRITNAIRYNCVKDTSPNHCTYADKGASDNNRIFYDSSKVELVRAGSKLLPGPASKGDNYLAWAELRQLSTNKRFLISDLHTVGEDKYFSYKKKQAQAAVSELTAQNPEGLPMIAVGDWNSSRFERPSNAPYDVYVKAGFVDPLGGTYRSTTKAPHATVKKRVRTWLNSSNSDWKRKAPAHRSWVNGSYIDYIMTTKMRVTEWETVAHLDKKRHFVGVIPSDHNLVRATVVLP